MIKQLCKRFIQLEEQIKADYTMEERSYRARMDEMMEIRKKLHEQGLSIKDIERIANK